jgi:hypothetical protein
MFRQHNTMMGDGVCWFGLFGYTFAVSFCNNSNVSSCLLFHIALCDYFLLCAILIALPGCWLLSLFYDQCNE